MDFVRQVIDSGLLDKIALPQSLKNRKVEIIIFPFDGADNETEKLSVDDFAGALKKYADPKLIPLEKTAWAEAAEDKHGDR